MKKLSVQRCSIIALAYFVGACGATVVTDDSSNDAQGIGAPGEDGQSDGGGAEGTEGGGTPGTPAVYREPSDCALADVAEHDDKCEAELHCAGGVVLAITCDGENDGTGTSLCTCFVGEAQKHGGLVEGERATACANAVANCTTPM